MLQSATATRVPEARACRDPWSQMLTVTRMSGGMQQPSRRLILAAVFSSCLGVGLIFGFQPPLIALILSRLGYSSFAIGAVTAASLIAVILCGPFYPRAIVRLGLKRCVVSGIVFAAP